LAGRSVTAVPPWRRLAVVVTGPVSLRPRGRWRAVRLAFSSPNSRLRALPWPARSRSGSGAPLPGSGTPSAIRTWIPPDITAARTPVPCGLLAARASRESPRRPARAAGGQCGRAARAVIVLARHTGPGDTFLLLYGLLAYAGRRPLLVLKHTLALDPWIDVLLDLPGGPPPRPAAPRRGDGDAHAGRDVAQTRAQIASDARQHRGVVGQGLQLRTPRET
jgi:hypothetical protein